MSTLREVLEARANSGYGVITHTELRTILDEHPKPDPDSLLAAIYAVLALHRKRVTQAVFGDCAAEACDHEDTCPTEPFEVCTACWNAAENIDSYFMEGQISSVAYPCPTVRAINNALANR